MDATTIAAAADEVRSGVPGTFQELERKARGARDNHTSSLFEVRARSAFREIVRNVLTTPPYRVRLNEFIDQCALTRPATHEAYLAELIDLINRGRLTANGFTARLDVTDPEFMTTTADNSHVCERSDGNGDEKENGDFVTAV